MSLDSQERTILKKLIYQEGKIKACKFLTQYKNLPLETAYQIVEELEKEINPNEFSHLDKKSGKKPYKKIDKGVSFLFGGIGLLMMGIAIWFTFYIQNELKQSIEVPGQVIDLLPNSGNSSGLAPVVAYLWEGDTLIYQSNLYSSPPSFQRGEQVSLYVNTENPNSVRINNFMDMYAFPVILGILGFVFFTIVIVGPIITRLRKA